MINLDSTRKNSSSRGRKFFKHSSSSFNRFQDFLVAKSKQKPKPAFFSDRLSLTGEVKIEKLNFSKTSSSNEFRPPKSIDKFHKSPTNRSGFTVPRQQILMSHTQTPSGNTKVWSFQSTNQEYAPRPQEIKAKIEFNAMQRFQDLFKKETNLRAKRIEEEQSKRLMKLLENTSRKNHDAKSNRNSDQLQNAYLNYRNVSKKTINQEEKNITENSNPTKDVNESAKDIKMKIKQTINSSKILNQTNSVNSNEIINKTKPIQEAQTINERNNNFTKNQNARVFTKDLNKKTINIDESIKNNELPKQQFQGNKKVLLKVETSQSENSEDPKQSKTQQEIKKSQPREELKKSQPREQLKYQDIRQSKKEQVKIVQNKQVPKSKKSFEEKKVVEQKNMAKEEQRQDEFRKKNSFKLQQPDLFESLTNAQIIEKVPELSLKQVQKAKSDENKGLNFDDKNFSSMKQDAKKQQQQKAKISLEQIIKNRQNPTLKSQSASIQQPLANIKPKTPITIKGAKQVKSSRNEPSPRQNNRYTMNRDDDEIDEIEDVAILQKGANEKIKKSDKKLEQASDKITTSNNNIRPSTTSIAQDLQKNNKPNTNTSTNQKQPSPTKTPPIQSKPQSSSRVQFPDSQQQQQHSPAEELGYLLDQLQTLGSYYTDSKHFYSQPDSSMVEIVMNHKTASYFLAQQYYFYISFFKHCAQSEEKGDFYSLTKEEFQEALEDEDIAEGIQELNKSSQLAVKLIKMTYEKCKVYLKKHQKQLTISPQINYHKQCLQYLKAEFKGIYQLYLQKPTSPLGKRLCYLIETYCLLLYLNQQDEVKDYEDVQDIEPQSYARHINQFKHVMGL